MSEATTTTEEPQTRQLTRDEAYQHLSALLDRLDRDIATMTQGAVRKNEVDLLWHVRSGLLNAQRDLHAAWRDSTQNEAAVAAANATS